MDDLRKFYERNSEFSHYFACWANNHMGWAKMKRFNRRLAKRGKFKYETDKKIRKEIDEYERIRNN